MRPGQLAPLTTSRACKQAAPRRQERTMTLARTKSWSGPNHTGQVQVNLVETIGRRVLTVSRVESLTPNYKRVYLTGEDLAEGFPFVHLAPTDHVKVLFPQPGSSEIVIPVRGPNGWVTEEGAPAPI